MPVPTTSLVLDLKAGVGLTLSGSEIAQWNDQSGLGNHCPGQTGNTSKPLNATDADGVAVVRFPWESGAAHPKAYFDIPAAIAVSTRACTVVAVAKCNNGTENQTLVSFDGFAAGYARIYQTSNAAPFLQVATRAGAKRVPVNKSVFVWAGRATDSVVQWNNDRQTGIASVGAATTTGGGDIGRYGTSANEYFSGDIYRLLIYNAALTDAQIDAVVTAVLAEHPCVTSYNKLLAAKGDSLTAGVGSTNLQNWVNQLVTPTFDWLTFNLGTGGQKIGALATSGTMANIASAQIDPLYTEFPYSRRVLNVLAGTNDISSDGITGSACFTRLTDFLSPRKTVGWETWVETLSDRSGSDTPISDFNVLVRAGHSTIDKVIDIGKDSAVENRLSDSTVTTYFNADQLHYSNGGYAVVANDIGPFSKVSGYTISGPSSGTSGVASTAFTVTRSVGTFNGLEAITLTASDGTITATAASGTITNNGTSAVTVKTASGASSFTFTYTPASTGSKTITGTNAQNWTNPSAATYTATSAADTTAPTVTGASINSAGATLTVTFSESTSPSSGATGFTLTASGGAVTLSAPLISGSTYTASLSRTILQGETLSLAYSPGNVTDTATTPNALASFSGQSVTNNSTQTAPVITSSTTKSGTVGSALSYTTTASGTTPITYSADTLPAGLSLDGSTGAITGTPTSAGTTVTTLTATNAYGSDTEILTFSISPQAATGYTLAGPAAGAIGQARTFTIAATPSGAVFDGSEVFTPAKGTLTGTLSAATVGPTASSTAVTFTFTGTATSSGNISVTDNKGWTDPSAIAFTVTAEAVRPQRNRLRRGLGLGF